MCMMKAVHLLLIVSIKSTAVFGEPCTSLDELTYDCLSFFDAAAPAVGGQQGEHLVLVLVCSCLLWASAQSEWLGVSYFFAVVMLDHCMFKDLSGFCHTHPSQVGKLHFKLSRRIHVCI